MIAVGLGVVDPVGLRGLAGTVSNSQLAQTAAIALTASVLIFSVVVPVAWRRASARSTFAIIRQLRSSGSYSLWVGTRRAVWNPAKPPGAGNRLVGPGEAYYSLGPDGLGQLTFVSASGQRRQFSGPIPDRLLDAAQRFSRVQVRVNTIYFGSMLVGFVLGVLLSSGGWAVRMLIGYLAAFAVMIFWSLMLRVYRVGHALRHLRD
ncbi:MAG: hypothetical protein J2P17_22595 [Mycobacterium sp.]|nr:hypothetical protein [Mycobacterium sp.]